MDIEHPDHTGASSNPLAPWNQPEETRQLACPVCHEEPPEGYEVAEGSPCLNTDPMQDPSGNDVPPCEGKYEYQDDDE